MKIRIIPGVNNSDSNHWQSIWEKKYGFQRINQEEWADPQYSDWSKNLIEALEEESDEDNVLVAHSLGCILVAKTLPIIRKHTKAIFLVAPPDLNKEAFEEFLGSFKGMQETNLNIPGILVYSENDPYSTGEFCKALGEKWGLETVSVGRKGHINSDSNIGEWDEGYALFQKLLSRV